jgi:serine/threonine protein kinase
VYNEIEVWAKVNHENVIKIYELIDSDDHDYLYIILELADLGQLATWDFKQELYIRNQAIYDTVLTYLKEEDAYREDQRELEQVARFIFRQLAHAVL